MTLPFNLRAGRLGDVDDCLQGLEIAMAMILLKRFSVRIGAEAVPRRIILPYCQWVTRRIWMRTAACGRSMILVVANQPDMLPINP